MESLNYQQELVWDLMKEAINNAEAANESLESRAGKMLTASCATASLIVTLGMLPKLAGGLGVLEKTMLLAMLALTMVITYFYMRVFAQRPVGLVASDDIKELYDKYISIEPDLAFQRALVGQCKAYDLSKWLNAVKAKDVRMISIMLRVQLAFMGIIAVVRILSM